NYGEKSDIARLAILQKIGGVYLDTDFSIIDICKLEKFCDYYDFIIGFEPIDHSFKLGNAFMASSIEHPCIQKMNKRLKSSFFDSVNYDNFKINTISKTGPNFVSKIIFENMKLIEGGILLPPTYLYPFTCTDGEELKFVANPMDYIKPETFGIHYWTQLWSNKTNPYIKIPVFPLKRS
ncbi:MAG: glycosyltransferase, partial [Parachlamydiales bacterium]